MVLPAAFLLSCCEPVIPDSYAVELPSLPQVWQDALGEPEWRLSWVNPGGSLSSVQGAARSLPEIDLPSGTPVPVTAQPFWPGLGIMPGAMKGAGAIFPWDAAGNVIRLSWEGGVDALFYLALAEASALSGAGEANPGAEKRRPEQFDWPRFRELFQGDDIPQAIKEDPWLADWQETAAKTVESGWDRRRIKVAEQGAVTIIIPGAGPWFGPSPFGPVRDWQEGDLAELPAADSVEILLSPGGMVRYTKSIWTWIPRESAASTL